MSTTVDDHPGPPARRQAAHVGEALFGDDHLDVVFGVVDVRHHRHDRGDRAVARGRRAEEHRQVTVAGEVTRAADTVHDARTHDMGRIDVAVDVGLEHPVHGDDAEPAHDLGMVADLLGAQHDVVAVEVDVAHELVDARLGQRERGGRRVAHRPVRDEFQHAVLDDLRVARQPAVRPAGESGEHRVGNVADTGLQRQQSIGGQAPGAPPRARRNRARARRWPD